MQGEIFNQIQNPIGKCRKINVTRDVNGHMVEEEQRNKVTG